MIVSPFIASEPTELAYEREQAQREAQDEAQIEQWGWDGSTSSVHGRKNILEDIVSIR